MFHLKRFTSKVSSFYAAAYHCRQQLVSVIPWCSKILFLPTATVTTFLLHHQTFHFQALASHLEKEDLQALLEKADSLYNNNKVSELYEFLKGCEVENNVELLWRLARAARDYATKDPSVSRNQKKELHYEALEYAKLALEVDKEHFASHKWFAITLGDVGDYEGIKTKISNAFKIQEHLERAIKLNPTDATTIYCLGMWHWMFANMPGWQRRIASYVFATPPSSSYKEAAQYFNQAEKAEPNFYSTNLLMLGKCHMEMGDYRRALLYFDRTVKYPALNNEDYTNREEAQNLIEQLTKKQKQLL